MRHVSRDQHPDTRLYLLLPLKGVPSLTHSERPPSSALLWELKPCLFQDILLRKLYKCLKICL